MHTYIQTYITQPHTSSITFLCRYYYQVFVPYCTVFDSSSRQDHHQIAMQCHDLHCKKISACKTTTKELSETIKEQIEDKRASKIYCTYIHTYIHTYILDTTTVHTYKCTYIIHTYGTYIPWCLLSCFHARRKLLYIFLLCLRLLRRTVHKIRHYWYLHCHPP